MNGDSAPLNDIWRHVRCSVCDGPFVDEDDWWNRHDDKLGDDCHDRCCPICAPDYD